ncbi:MAG: HAD family phosphatase, partial [Planctomycetes bacterium]|nr:HAD family phosphatase [Planctomycetota bacterium]
MRAVIWDFDGVIVDAEPLHYEAFRRALAERGVVLDREVYYAEFLPLDDAAFFERARERLGLMGDVAALSRRKREIYQEVLRADGVRVFPGVRELLAAVGGSLRQAIASGSTGGEVRQICAMGGITRHFAAIVTIDDVARGKPAPDLFLEAACRLRAAPAGCLVIEDSPSGVEAARAAGMKALAVTTSRPAAALGRADRVVASLEGLDPEDLARLW